jgi:homospermidine synthase
MIDFKNKILFVGYGAVAECTLPILFKLLKVPAKNVTVMDFEDRAEKLRPWTARGVRFVRDRVTEENLGSLLGRYLVGWRPAHRSRLEHRRLRGAPVVPRPRRALRQHLHRAVGPVRRCAQQASDRAYALLAAHEPAPPDGDMERKGPTAVIEHGANPGLISHFTKQG